MTLRDIRPKEDVPLLLKNVKESIENFNTSGLWRHVKKSGEIILVEITSHLIDYNGLKARHVMALDVTEKTKSELALKASEEKYRTIFDNVQDVFYQTDLDGIIREISPSIKYSTDFEREDLIAHSVVELYSDYADRQKLLSILKRDGEIRDYQIRLKSKSGKIRYGSINARLIYNELGKPDHIDGAIRDITERIEAEETLRKSESKFRNLFENHAAPSFILELESLKIIEANHAAVRFYGWSTEEFRQLQVSDINALPAENLRKILYTIRIEKKGHFEFIHKLKDGTRKEVEIFGSEIQLDGKKYIHEIIHDITETKRATAMVRLLSKSIEQSPVSVVISDPDGKIEYVNPKFLETTGYSFEEVVGQNPRILSSGHQTKEFYKSMWDTILSGKQWNGEFLNKKKNGDLYWENASISALVDENGKITHLVGIKEDITESKRIHAELVAAKDRAEASDKLKTAFINNISHEVRTPLNGILGFSEMLLNPSFSHDKKKQFSDIIRKSGVRLLNTINSYMDISMIVSGNIEVRPKAFSLIPLLNDIHNEYREACEDKSLELRISRPSLPDNIQIMTDPDMLRKCISYLIDNAIKFTTKGTITFGFRKNVDQLEIFVEDTGIGIEAEKLNVIFDNFMQGDISLTRGYEGSGLGLSITNGLVRLMGGSIRVTSVPGNGSCFCMNLPASIIQPIAVPLKTLQKKENKVVSIPLILVAEDDDFNYKFIEIVLKKESYVVLRAENGIQAVKLCKEHPGINLILMDIKMPIMGGLEATREIKKFRPDVPIIALTAYVSASDEYQAYLFGCDDFLSKPVNRVKLLTTVNSALKVE